MPDMTTKPVTSAELSTPLLNALEKNALVMALNSVILGAGTVSAAFLYDKQTATKARIAGEDYVKMPGVSAKATMGDIVLVCRQVNNAANRRKGTVGRVYFLVPNTARATGASKTSFSFIRPAGVSEFVVTSFIPTEV